MKVSSPDRQLALNLDLFELWEVDEEQRVTGKEGLRAYCYGESVYLPSRVTAI